MFGGVNSGCRPSAGAANLPAVLPASAACILRGFGAAAPEPGNVHDPGDGGRDDDGRRQAERQQRDGNTGHKSAVTVERSKKKSQRAVSRILFPAAALAGCDATMTIPLASPLLARSSDLPGGPLDGPSSRHVAYAPLFGLAPCGVLPATPVARARCALTAPFHPYPRSRRGLKPRPTCVGPALQRPSRPAGGIFSVPLSFRLP